MVPRHCRDRGDRAGGFSDQSDLVSAVESESVLRESFRGSYLQRTGAAHSARISRAARNHQSQRQTERRIARASANGHRPLEERPGSTPSVFAGSTISVAKTFDPRAGFVFARPGGGREMAVSQLSGQSTLRSAEPVPLLHG